MLDLSNTFTVIDSHTAGHPTRVISTGIPNLPGLNVREQRDYFKKHFDYLRPLLLHEPRGHSATVALVPVHSTVADFGAFFISSYIYLDMCGHATIGYAKTLAASGQIGPQSAEHGFTLETPAGIVTVGLDWLNAGQLASVRLVNVASRLGLRDLAIDVSGHSINVDIAYGGIWYAIADATSLALRLKSDTVSQALEMGVAIKAAVNERLKQLQCRDPEAVSSVLFFESIGPHSAKHLVVLAANKFDRSPCGTGTSARLAQLQARHALVAGQQYEAQNILGVGFTARIVEVVETEGKTQIVPEIVGNAHITSFSTIVCERTDPLLTGFLCR
jgi:proline racemase